MNVLLELLMYFNYSDNSTCTLLEKTFKTSDKSYFSLYKVSSKFSHVFSNNHNWQSGVCNFKADSRLSHIIVHESEVWGLIMTMIWQWHVPSFIWAVVWQDGKWREVPHSKRSCRDDGKGLPPRRARCKGSPSGKGNGEWCHLPAQWGISGWESSEGSRGLKSYGSKL